MRHQIIRLAGVIALAAIPLSSHAVAQTAVAAATSVPFASKSVG